MRHSPASPELALSRTAPPSATTWAETARALFVLTKPRLGFFSVLTTMAAYAGARHSLDLGETAATFVGAGLAAGCALSLNHWWERDTDTRMRRTRDRPLPRGTVSPAAALAWCLCLGVSGTVLLAWKTHPLAALLAVFTILIYGVVYTPLKKRTRWATELGSISGALPPLLGAAAAGDVFSLPAWVLAAVLVFWQMPHFFAIGWRHRDDYRSAGFPLLPAIDPTGRATAAWSFGYTAALLVVSLLPTGFGWLGAFYGVAALAAGGFFLIRAWQFLRAKGTRDDEAKRLFIASILYLPALMSALVLDRWLARL